MARQDGNMTDRAADAGRPVALVGHDTWTERASPGAVASTTASATPSGSVHVIASVSAVVTVVPEEPMTSAMIEMRRVIARHSDATTGRVDSDEAPDCSGASSLCRQLSVDPSFGMIWALPPLGRISLSWPSSQRTR